MENTRNMESTIPMDHVEKKILSAKNVALMAIFGALSSMVGLTTNLIPAAAVPGLYAAIALPAGTIFVLIARELVGKTGAATFTQFISGFISTFLPGGPPVIWIILPTWVLGGLIIDLYFHVIHKNVSDSRVTTGLVGFIYNIPSDFILYMVFTEVLHWFFPLSFFLWSFILIHSLLGGLAAIFVPDIINRISPVIDQIPKK